VTVVIGLVIILSYMVIILSTIVFIALVVRRVGRIRKTESQTGESGTVKNSADQASVPVALRNDEISKST